MRLVYGTVLIVILSLAWISPFQAVPQLSLPTGNLVVTITSPAAGSTVTNTITVSGSVSPLGALLEGVQFKLDGVNLGAEDTAAPYSVSWNTVTTGNGPHTLTAVARNFLNIHFPSDPVTVTVFNDKTPPTTSITSPAAGSTVSSTISVTANASDNVAVAGVQLQLDGVNLGAEYTAAPYSTSWNTTMATNGSHTLTAIARDTSGNQATSSPVTVTVLNDSTPPTVAFTSPAGGSTVGGTISLIANASDNVAVAGVQFKVDGVGLGAEDTTAPYSTSWNTTTATNASHTLTAVARDTSGNQTTSSPLTVTVFNDSTPPTVTITSPASSSTVGGTVNVTADASDNVAVAGVLFKLDGVELGAEDTTAPYSASWNTTTATNGSHTLTAVARDGSTNQTTSSPVTVTVFNDTTAPTVTITSPASSSTVGGTVNVTADASDNVAVAGVQFKLDGVDLGAEDTTAPYSASWNTTTATNGSHILTAVARDGSSNRTTSSPVTVVVLNDSTPPTVTITSPSSGSSVGGTITISADASDNVGVAGVQFKLDDVDLGAEATAAP
ncbi:MAG TPA: Ig-like domain-containing protein, partial [Terriglobia bacterium]|nr:Ig-like domain-containing protein [Terriglobia bacterium]